MSNIIAGSCLGCTVTSGGKMGSIIPSKATTEQPRSTSKKKWTPKTRHVLPVESLQCEHQKFFEEIMAKKENQRKSKSKFGTTRRNEEERGDRDGIRGYVRYSGKC